MHDRYTIAALFVVGIALGCWAEFVRPPGAWLGPFVLPGVFLSLFLGIGPHGSAWPFELAFPLCSGVVYAGGGSLALWLHAKASKRGSTGLSDIR